MNSGLVTRRRYLLLRLYVAVLQTALGVLVVYGASVAGLRNPVVLGAGGGLVGAGCLFVVLTCVLIVKPPRLEFREGGFALSRPFSAPLYREWDKCGPFEVNTRLIGTSVRFRYESMPRPRQLPLFDNLNATQLAELMNNRRLAAEPR